MEKKLFDEIRSLEFSLLCELDRICRKHNITYYLGWGTLLGAVRHKGYIPWDDDIDVLIPIDELVRFEEVCKHELRDDCYVQSRNINKYNSIFWRRIGLKNTTSADVRELHIHADYGLCIDIFPIYQLPDDESKRSAYIKKIRTFKLLSLKYLHALTLDKAANKKEKIKKLIHKFTPDFVNLGWSNHLLKYFVAKQQKDGKEYIDYAENNPIFYPADIFEERIELEFEGKMFYAPAKYDEYLKICYGDYMKLPPENERVNHKDNEFELIDTHTPYQNYFK